MHLDTDVIGSLLKLLVGTNTACFVGFLLLYKKIIIGKQRLDDLWEEHCQANRKKFTPL